METMQMKFEKLYPGSIVAPDKLVKEVTHQNAEKVSWVPIVIGVIVVSIVVYVVVQETKVPKRPIEPNPEDTY